MKEFFTLHNGVRMPAVGFGTWSITPDDNAARVVGTALEAGYRHVDTAKLYANEAGVGRAVQSSGISRKDIFVATKLWSDAHAYDAAHQAFEESRARLGLDYVDLYLIHSPQAHDAERAWPALVDMYKSGELKAIGVSNFAVEDLQAILSSTDTPPMVNQIELHPYNYRSQKEIIDFCAVKGIVVQAYSPLKQHTSSGSNAIEELARHYGKTSSQVILRWCLQHGTAPLPRSTNPDHIRENLDIFNFELAADAMRLIDDLS